MKATEDTQEQSINDSLMKAVCFWRFSEVSDTISAWLDHSDDLERTGNTTVGSSAKCGASSNKRRRKIRFTVPSRLQAAPKPRLALRYLEFVLSNPECRRHVLGKHRDQLVRLCSKLDDFLAIYDIARIRDIADDKIGLAEILLADRLHSSLRFLLVARDKPNSIEDLVTHLKARMWFHENNTFPLIQKDDPEAAVSYLQQFLLTCRHAFMLGFCNVSFVDAVSDFLTLLMDNFEHNVKIFCDLAPTVFNLVDFVYNNSDSGETFDFTQKIMPLVDRWTQKIVELVKESSTDLNAYKGNLKSGTEAVVESLQMLVNDRREKTAKMAGHVFSRLKIGLQKKVVAQVADK